MAKPDTATFCPWDITPKFPKHCCFWDQASSKKEHVPCIRGAAQVGTSLGIFISSKWVLRLQLCITRIFDSGFVFVSVYETSTYIAPVVTSEESNIGKSWILTDVPISTYPNLKNIRKKIIKLNPIDFIYLLTKLCNAVSVSS